jgi:hypothetical protein
MENQELTRPHGFSLMRRASIGLYCLVHGGVLPRFCCCQISYLRVPQITGYQRPALHGKGHIGERIRDKIAASKRKGMWMGGVPPLGYRVEDHKLIVIDSEAEIVRSIFRRYAELGSVWLLKAELEARGSKSKSWTSASGRLIGGQPFSHGAPQDPPRRSTCRIATPASCRPIRRRPPKRLRRAQRRVPFLRRVRIPSETMPANKLFCRRPDRVRRVRIRLTAGGKRIRTLGPARNDLPFGGQMTDRGGFPPRDRSRSSAAFCILVPGAQPCPDPNLPLSFIPQQTARPWVLQGPSGIFPPQRSAGLCISQSLAALPGRVLIEC